MERKLAAILYADVAGYSRLTGADEEGTHTALKAHLGALTEAIQGHGGRICHFAGDAVLVEFASVVTALECAVAAQRDMAKHDRDLTEDRKLQFRIGVNLGDVIIDGDEIYGNGVNVAVRLEDLAEPGGICISDRVLEQVERKVDVGFAYLGEQTVKNIEERVKAYKVLLGAGSAGKVIGVSKPHAPTRWRRIIALAVIALVVGTGGVATWLHLTKPSVQPAKLEKMAFPLPEKPSIAVLPFDNLSGDPEQEYFADGITDDLITDLSKVSGLFVIARHSVFTYKGKPVKVQQVAEELGVRYVLEGSVRRADGRIRINAQLTDATKGQHLWADRYDREYTDIFALQDEVTQRIVSALFVQLTEGEKAQLTSRRTDNLEAYEYYLRGQKTVHSFSISYPEELNTALLMYVEAIKRDPKFARAHGGHALVSYYIWRVAYVVPTRSIIEARANALNSVIAALALDPKVPEAYSVLAQVLLADGRYEEAMAAAANAVSLDPNNADSYVVQALVTTKAGKHKEALKTMAKAYRLNPKPPPHYDLYLGKIYFDNRDYIQAIENLEKGMREQPRASLFHWYLAPAYAYQGRLDEARAEVLGILGFVPQENLMRLRRIGLYKLQRDVDHYIEGFRRAGVPELPFGYEVAEEAKLSGDDLRALLFGRTTMVTNTRNFQQYLVDRTVEGRLTVRGPFGSDVGTSFIVGDRLCDQLQSLGSRSSCGFVFRKGVDTTERKETYQWVKDEGIFTISLAE